MLNNTQMISLINNYYISYRKKYIKDFKESYVQISHNINDFVLKAHLNKEKVLGVFSGVKSTKFMLFDIDGQTTEESKVIASSIIDALINIYDISEEYILLVDSGNKGYHITLFFEDLMSLKVAKRFYSLVLNTLNLSPKKVEFRPTFTQAVKLPFSNHIKTKKKSSLLNLFTFEPIHDLHLGNILKLEVEEFSEFVYEKEKEFINLNLLSAYNKFSNETNNNKDLHFDTLAYIQRVIETNSLIEKDSRHQTTLLLAMYFNNVGLDMEEAKDKITEIIHQTYSNKRYMISARTTFKKSTKEINRLVKLAYTKNYKLDSTATSVKFYKEEINKILAISDKRLRQFAIVLLAHSKRYSVSNVEGVFSFAFRQITSYGLNMDFSSIYKSICELSELGLIERVNEQDIQETVGYKPTSKFKVFYRVENSTDQFIEYTLDDLRKLDIDEVSCKLLSEKELKESYPKTTFYRKIKGLLIYVQNLDNVNVQTIIKRNIFKKLKIKISGKVEKMIKFSTRFNMPKFSSENNVVRLE